MCILRQRNPIWTHNLCDLTAKNPTVTSKKGKENFLFSEMLFICKQALNKPSQKE